MSTVAVEQRVMPEEYLTLERASPHKSEYFNGRIYAMAGASREHNLVTFNFGLEIGNCLRDHPCEAYIADMHVKVERTTSYVYPDVAVVCGEPQFEDTGLDTLLNPVVIIEVLSFSTEGDDRGAKFAIYRRLESLQEYVLVAQHRPRVERYARRADGWLLTDYDGLDATLTLNSIQCDIPLRRLYAKVTFPTPDVPQL